MSRSSGGFKELRHPCKHWLQWKNGQFVRYDKEAKENVAVSLDGGFHLLDDRLMRIAGFNNKRNTGVHSNEVRTVEDVLQVWFYNNDGTREIVAHGPYSKIKDTVTSKAIGGKYATSIYIAIAPEYLDIESEELLEIANIEASGGCLQGWIEFCDKVSRGDFNTHRVKLAGADPRIKGTVNYMVPVFAMDEERAPQSELQLATLLDKTLQEYLEDYLANNRGASSTEDMRRQANAGEESQETNYEEERPKTTTRQPAGKSQNRQESADNPLDFQLKEGKVGDYSIEQLREMLGIMDEHGLSKQSPKYQAIEAGLRLKQEAVKKKPNPFSRNKPVEEEPAYEPIAEDDDDIPF